MNEPEPGSLRVMACVTLADPTDIGEIVALLPPGATHNDALAIARRYALDNRGVDVCVGHFDAFKRIWLHWAHVCYGDDWDIDIESGVIRSRPTVNDTSIETDVARARREFERQRKSVERKTRRRSRQAASGDRH